MSVSAPALATLDSSVSGGAPPAACGFSGCQTTCYSSYTYTSYTLATREVVGTLTPSAANPGGCQCYTPLVSASSGATNTSAASLSGTLDFDGVTATAFVANFTPGGFSLALPARAGCSLAFLAAGAAAPMAPSPVPPPPAAMLTSKLPVISKAVQNTGLGALALLALLVVAFVVVVRRRRAKKAAELKAAAEAGATAGAGATAAVVKDEAPSSFANPMRAGGGSL